MRKIETKQDLIEYIASLPDSWVPTKCIQWACPMATAIALGYREQEITQYVDIRLDGPVITQQFDTSLDG